MGFPFNICATAEASNFKFGAQLGIAKAHNKTRGKSGRGLGLGELPNIWGSSLIFLQRPRCPLSVSGASCLACLRRLKSSSVLMTIHSWKEIHVLMANDFITRKLLYYCSHYLLINPRIDRAIESCSYYFEWVCKHRRTEDLNSLLRNINDNLSFFVIALSEAIEKQLRIDLTGRRGCSDARLFWIGYWCSANKITFYVQHYHIFETKTCRSVTKLHLPHEEYEQQQQHKTSKYSQ